MNELLRNFRRICGMRTPFRASSPQAGLWNCAEEVGSTLIETAMVLPVFLLFVFMVIQMGRVVYEYHAVVEAAREASRWAAVRGSQCYSNLASTSFCSSKTGSVQSDIKAYVVSLGYPGLTDANVGVTASWEAASISNNGNGATTTWAACTCNDPGDMVLVTVTYPLTLPIPMMKITPTFSLSSTSSMVLSQ